MKIDNILTKRYTRKYNPQTYQATQIVYEWEDVISQEMGGVKIETEPSKATSLLIEMSPEKDRRKYNSPNVIPWIVDFFLRDFIKLIAFYVLYCFNKVVIISSKEAYDYLKSHFCPLRIVHVALSLPDKYRITADSKFEKNYDLVLIGRVSPVLKDYALRYASIHEDFKYAYQVREKTNWMIYDQDNHLIGCISNRKDYMDFMTQSRVMLYSTPSMDGEGSTRSHGFNQVTPKFLEYIASGCHVIARYPQNSDVEYYELDRMVLANVKDYEAFEKAMDYARSNDVDMKKYSEYLAKHYTSVRVKELQTILDKI